MEATISTKYVLKWELAETPWYRFTTDGTCINTKTGRRIKQTMCGRSIGYCINGRFMALNTLRPLLRKIDYIDCPF